MSGHRYHPRIRVPHTSETTVCEPMLERRTGPDLGGGREEKVLGMMAVDNIVDVGTAHIPKRSSQYDGNIRSHFPDGGKDIGVLFCQRTMHQDDVYIGESPQQFDSILRVVRGQYIVLGGFHHELARGESLGLLRLDHQDYQGWHLTGRCIRRWSDAHVPPFRSLDATPTTGVTAPTRMMEDE